MATAKSLLTFFSIPPSQFVFFADEKYGYLDARAGYAPPSTMIESSFKHYPETGVVQPGGGVGVREDLVGMGQGGPGGPELISMTSSSLNMPPTLSAGPQTTMTMSHGGWSTV